MPLVELDWQPLNTPEIRIIGCDSLAGLYTPRAFPPWRPTAQVRFFQGLELQVD